MIEFDISFCQKYPIICLATFITIIPIIMAGVRKIFFSKTFLLLFVYLIIKLIIDLLMFHFASHGKSTLIFYNFSLPINYLVLSGMYYTMFENQLYKRWLLWSILAFSFFSIWDIIHVNKNLMNLHDHQVALYSGTIQSLLMIFWILLYLYETIQLLKISNLFKFSFFWICAGFLLYFSSQVFIASVLHYTEQWTNPLDLGFIYNVPYIFEIVCAILISVGINYFSLPDYAKQ